MQDITFSTSKLSLLAGGLVLLSWCLSAPSFGAESQPTAAQLMQAAHDGRAVWKNFPGFRAAVTARQNGKQATGTVTVSAEGGVTLTLDSDAGFEWVAKTFDSMIGHRLAESGPANTNVEFATSDDAQHPLGRLIKSKDATEHSLWRVQGDVFTEVHRVGPTSRFAIRVSDVYRTPEGTHLPQNFSVITWNPQTGELLKTRQVHHQWIRVGQTDLPQVWWAATQDDKGQQIVQQLELSQIELLDSKAITSPK